jgi:Enterobacter phage Enc34, ssDNA-binding protein
MLTLALMTAMRLPVRQPDRGLYFTPVFRVSFPHLDTPWGNQQNPNAPPAFQLNALFADDADLGQMRALLDQALIGRFGPMAPQLVSAGAFKYALRPKAVKANFQGYEGPGYFASLRARQETPPACVDISTGKPVLLQIGAIERVLYAGCYAYAAYNVFAFDKGGGKGVSCGLRTLVKVAEGEAFAGLPPVTKDEAAAAIANVSIPGVISMGSTIGFQIPGQAEQAVYPTLQPTAAPATVAPVVMPVAGREQDLLDAMQ